MEKLLNEYQDTVLTLYRKRLVLQDKLSTVSGREWIALQKRIVQLYIMQSDVEYAIRLLIKSAAGGEKNADKRLENGKR